MNVPTSLEVKYTCSEHVFQDLDSTLTLTVDLRVYFNLWPSSIIKVLYQGIFDCVNTEEVQSNRLRQVIVLPVSFIGGPRDMRKRFLDSMTLVQDVGKPDIFLTMTCNPNWSDFKENLYEGQTAQDRPDLVTRVFRAKLKYLKHQLFTKHILGTGKTFLYKALLPNVRSRGLIALATASSGAAVNNMTWGRTAQSRFKIPINLTTNSMCNIKKQSGLAKLLCQASDRVEEVIDEYYIRIPNDMTIPYTNNAASMNAFINEIFPSFTINVRSTSDIVSRAILSTKNDTEHVGVRVLLLRIRLAPSEEDMFPFKLKRTQLPIRLSFAMTINKAQGQTILNVGVYLPESIFSYGQLYVALSRGISRTTSKAFPYGNSSSFSFDILFLDVSLEPYDAGELDDYREN
nr:ATP-dependent DNA helicase PIF1-like [Tanacetum cinerariifolium]